MMKFEAAISPSRSDNIGIIIYRLVNSLGLAVEYSDLEG